MAVVGSGEGMRERSAMAVVKSSMVVVASSKLLVIGDSGDAGLLCPRPSMDAVFKMNLSNKVHT